jgi:TolB protein
MTDIRERFRVFDRIEPPDLWPEAERRAPAEESSLGPRTARRLGIGLLALALAAAGFALAVRAIGSRGGREPATTSTNGRIAFVGFDGTTWQIYSVDPDGSRLTQLTHVSDLETAADPAWSPDGTRIAFVINEFERDGGTGPSRIWIMNADGSDARRLPTGARSSWSPAWSPDGSQIAFAAGDPSHVYVVDADGTNSRRLTQDRGWCWANPSWSPDGAEIVFDQAGGECDKDLYVMAADGSGQHPLMKLPGWQIEPAWSPDGSTIAFAASDDDGAGFGIYAVNADGSNLRKVSDQPAAQSPAWSPDGNKIVFSASLPGTSDDTALYMMNADGTDVLQLPNLPKGASFPTWQPI